MAPDDTSTTSWPELLSFDICSAMLASDFSFNTHFHYLLVLLCQPLQQFVLVIVGISYMA